jgi:hypothetical protein
MLVTYVDIFQGLGGLTEMDKTGIPKCFFLNEK